MISISFAKHLYQVKTEERPVLFCDGRKLSLYPATSSSLTCFSVAHWNPLDTDFDPNDVEMIPNHKPDSDHSNGNFTVRDNLKSTT